MNAIDFSNSYHTFFGASGGNNSRHHIDAACTVLDDSTGASQTFFLVAPCRGERMYLESELFHMPSYEFAGIWGTEEHLQLRRHWSYGPGQPGALDEEAAGRPRARQYGKSGERFRDVRLDIHTFPRTRVLDNASDIAAVNLELRPLVARTELRHEASSRRAFLEYPVRTMNMVGDPPRFQVDTGPMLVPDFESQAEHAIERIDLAYVVYNVFDRAEFILRRPTPILHDGNPVAWTSDYSVVKVLEARHQIMCPA